MHITMFWRCSSLDNNGYERFILTGLIREQRVMVIYNICFLALLVFLLTYIHSNYIEFFVIVINYFSFGMFVLDATNFDK